MDVLVAVNEVGRGAHGGLKRVELFAPDGLPLRGPPAAQVGLGNGLLERQGVVQPAVAFGQVEVQAHGQVRAQRL